jgi:hypothetical protein
MGHAKPNKASVGLRCRERIHLHVDPVLGFLAAVKGKKTGVLLTDGS